jgi:AcrR family transcriptional regulator
MATPLDIEVPRSTSTERHLRPRKQPRQQRAVETRARILDAAATVFEQQGYAAGTTNRIAEAAGMSVGSLYQYFPNKDAILNELVHQHMQEGVEVLVPVLQRAQQQARPVAELVHDVLVAFIDLHVRRRRLHQVLFEESPRPPSLLRELHELEDGVVAVTAQMLAASSTPPDHPEMAARIAVTTIESLVHRMVASDRPLDTVAFEREVTRMVTGYLVPVG